MQNNIHLTQGQIERRADELERTLINQNPTTERILAACRRINRQWNSNISPEAIETKKEEANQ